LSGWSASARRLLPLAWPVFIGQIAVLAFSTVDTMVVARHAALDLAALAIGGASYITVFVGLMGVVLAVGPIAGQLYGAQRLHECGAQLHQAMWLALALAVLGSTALLFPQPFIALARADAGVADKARGYLTALAFALPPALLFTAFRGFNTAVSRPKVVMLLQLGALALKVPLTAALVFGVPSLGLPSLGVTGCGVATAVVMWAQAAAAWWLVRHDPFYRRFELQRGFARPARAPLLALLRLGVPMGGSILIEVTGFTFMTFFISRISSGAVAAHQVAVNVVSLMFMMSLAIANASSTLVAQRVGAGDIADARRIGWHGVEIGTAVAALLGAAMFLLREPILRLYTGDAAVIAAALPLLAWVALFHIADAAQTVAAFVLRAWRIATVPLVVYVLALWGIGLGGGYWLAFVWADTPAPLQGAQGYWAASTAGLTVAALALAGYLGAMLRHQRRLHAA
jgi:MATE family multidrug resistance protein